MWDFEYGEYLSTFKAAANRLQINLSPYQTRHSGPSIDRAKKLRTLHEVQKRGNWRSNKSVLRYEKAGRLSLSYQNLQPRIKEEVLLGKRHPPRRAVRRCHKQYFLDLFSGVGGVARALRRLGFSVYEYDIANGQQFDLTNKKVLFKLLSAIRSGKVLGVMIAMPCTSFSVARDRTAIIRSRDHPWGLPEHHLSERDAEKVRIGNLCLNATLLIIHACQKSHVPWVLENPHSSKLWMIPEIQALVNDYQARPSVVDFCAYKTPWRKRTRLLSGHVDPADLSRLTQRVCQGRKGCCSLQQRNHFALTGKGPDNRPWTLIAQPYPPGLCVDLAHLLSAQAIFW